MRRVIRFPQWWMLLVVILGILSGYGSLVGMERFAIHLTPGPPRGADLPCQPPAGHLAGPPIARA